MSGFVNAERGLFLQISDSPRSRKCAKKQRKDFFPPFRFDRYNMDLRGVEPLSESLAIATSPITVYLYAFAVPSGSADKRASTFGSFIIRPCGQSFPRVVSYVIDARVRTRRCALSDSCH